MNTNFEIEKPDIKISVRQTFGLDTDMEIDAFSKKINMFQKLILIINLIEIQLLQFFLVLLLINEFSFKVITELENQLI